MRRPVLVAAALLAAAAAVAQTPPGDEKTPVTEVTDLVNTLLGGLLGGAQVDGQTLQKEVEEAGGLPFRRDVPLAFLGRDELAAYLDSRVPDILSGIGGLGLLVLVWLMVVKPG